jgi:hypothetical protein
MPDLGFILASRFHELTVLVVLAAIIGFVEQSLAAIFSGDSLL